MMKTLGLVLCLMLVVAGASVAATVTFDVYPGWNMIAAPLVPINPDPSSVFAGASDGIDGLLFRNDASTGYVAYDSLDTSLFGNVLLGDGYWLNVYNGVSTISYTGLADGVPSGGVMTDMWISLPGSQTDGIDAGGWHMIGMPFNHNRDVDPTMAGIGDGIFFTDGTSLKNWSEACAASWVDSKISGNDPVYGGFDVQYDGLGATTLLEAGRGYWLNTYKDNLALIIPAN